MVSQAWRNCVANSLRSPPEFNGPRSMTGTSSVSAARTICCMLLSLFRATRTFVSRTYNAFARHVHPEYDSALRDADQTVKPHADHGKDDQNGESAGHVEIEVLLQDEVSETCLRADEFADDRSYDRQHDGDVETNKNIG